MHQYLSTTDNTSGENGFMTIIQGALFKEFPENKGCLHDSCKECKNGEMNHIHMISCPCPKCTPQY